MHTESDQLFDDLSEKLLKWVGHHQVIIMPVMYHEYFVWGGAGVDINQKFISHAICISKNNFQN